MELMGRGFCQIIQESPLYFQILLKFAGYKLFNKRSPLYGSADIINVCNLHCDHCYWWLNRKENEFFDKAQKTVLSKEEEQEMFEQFQSVMVITKKIEEMIKQIDFLENQAWVKN